MAAGLRDEFVTANPVVGRVQPEAKPCVISQLRSEINRAFGAITDQVTAFCDLEATEPMNAAIW